MTDKRDPRESEREREGEREREREMERKEAASDQTAAKFTVDYHI